MPTKEHAQTPEPLHSRQATPEVPAVEIDVQPGIVERAQRAPHTLGAGDMLQLQRSLGNRAVSRLHAPTQSSQQRRSKAPQEHQPAHGDVQRQTGSTDGGIGQRPRSTDLQMKPLPSLTGAENLAESDTTSSAISLAPMSAGVLQRRIGHGGEKGDKVKDTDRASLEFVIGNVKKKAGLPIFGRNYRRGVTLPVESYAVTDVKDIDHSETVKPEDPSWELFRREQRLADVKEKEEEAEEKWSEDADDSRGLLATSFDSKKKRLLELKSSIEMTSERLNPIVTRLTGSKGEPSTLESVAGTALSVADKIASYVPGAQIAKPYIQAIKTAKTIVTTLRALIVKVQMLKNPAHEPLLDASIYVGELREALEEVGEVIGTFENSDQRFAALWGQFSNTTVKMLTMALSLEARARTALGGSNETKEQD